MANKELPSTSALIEKLETTIRAIEDLAEHAEKLETLRMADFVSEKLATATIDNIEKLYVSLGIPAPVLSPHALVVPSVRSMAITLQIEALAETRRGIIKAAKLEISRFKKSQQSQGVQDAN